MGTQKPLHRIGDPETGTLVRSVSTGFFLSADQWSPDPCSACVFADIAHAIRQCVETKLDKVEFLLITASGHLTSGGFL